MRTALNVVGLAGPGFFEVATRLKAALRRRANPSARLRTCSVEHSHYLLECTSMTLLQTFEFARWRFWIFGLAR